MDLADFEFEWVIKSSCLTHCSGSYEINPVTEEGKRAKNTSGASVFPSLLDKHTPDFIWKTNNNAEHPATNVREDLSIFNSNDQIAVTRGWFFNGQECAYLTVLYCFW